MSPARIAVMVVVLVLLVLGIVLLPKCGREKEVRISAPPAQPVVVASGPTIAPPASQVEVTQLTPGQARLVVKNVNANFRGTLPSGIKTFHTGPDASGTGQAHLVSGQEPQIAGKQLCWRGIGEHWQHTACGPIANGQAAVTYTAPNPAAKNLTFVLVPEIRETSGSFLAWAAHPENVQNVLECPGKTDYASFFRLDSQGKITPATDAEVKAYQDWHRNNRC